MHLHGGFYFQDKYTKTEAILPPHEACLIWGINGDEKSQQMKGGIAFPISYPLEIPQSLFEQYLYIMQTDIIDCIDIFGYSGENDQHINDSFSKNPNIKEIVYFCDPHSVNSETRRFEVKEKFMISNERKLILSSWNNVWHQLQK